MKLIASIAAATLMTTAFSAPAVARQLSDCADFGCYSIKLGRHYDNVAWQFNNGDYFIGNITCTPGKYRLHDGWWGSLKPEHAGAIAKAHCSNRGQLL